MFNSGFRLWLKNFACLSSQLTKKPRKKRSRNVDAILPSLHFETARFFTAPDVNFHHFKWLKGMTKKIISEKKVPVLLSRSLIDSIQQI